MNIIHMIYLYAVIPYNNFQLYNSIVRDTMKFEGYFTMIFRLEYNIISYIGMFYNNCHLYNITGYDIRRVFFNDFRLHMHLNI